MRRCPRPFRFCIEFVAALTAVAVLLGGFLIYRLSMGPLSTTVLTPYLSQALTSRLPSATADIKSSVLTWDNTNHSIDVHAETIDIKSASGSPIARIPSLDVRISVI